MSPVVVIGDKALNAAAAVVFAVPPLAIGSAVPLRVKASVPELVMGEPPIDRKDGTVMATEVTVPDPFPLNVFQSVELKAPVVDIDERARDKTCPGIDNPLAVPRVTSPVFVPERFDAPIVPVNVLLPLRLWVVLFTNPGTVAEADCMLSTPATSAAPLAVPAWASKLPRERTEPGPAIANQLDPSLTYKISVFSASANAPLPEVTADGKSAKVAYSTIWLAINGGQLNDDI